MHVYSGEALCSSCARKTTTHSTQLEAALGCHHGRSSGGGNGSLSIAYVPSAPRPSAQPLASYEGGTGGISPEVDKLKLACFSKTALSSHHSKGTAAVSHTAHCTRAMILDKPLSVGHFGEKGQTCVIYSVHVHPDGSRFATGGGDHRVKIWSMEPFRTPPSAVRGAADALVLGKPPATGAPPAAGVAPTKIAAHVQGEEVKVLAVLPQHTGSVLCVRWSHGGRYLASASDDTYVLIWELRPADALGGGGSSVPFGSSDTPNAENWARVWVLRGHSMDVLDCAW